MSAETREGRTKVFRNNKSTCEPHQIILQLFSYIYCIYVYLPLSNHLIKLCTVFCLFLFTYLKKIAVLSSFIPVKLNLSYYSILPVFKFDGVNKH